VNKSNHHTFTSKCLPTHDFSRPSHGTRIDSALWRVCRARAVKALGTSRTPDDLYRVHGLLFGLCRATNLLLPSHILQPTKSTHTRHQVSPPHITKYTRPINPNAPQSPTIDSSDSGPASGTRPHNEILPANGRLRLLVGRSLDEQLAEIRALE
jgi:hypothetical protein